MEGFYVRAGDSVSFAKTVGEHDVYGFAGITGDFAPNHVNEQYMGGARFGRRIAHGALLVGYMSTCSTMLVERHGGWSGEETAVSLGYDRIRFLAPVYLGDTVTLTYTVVEADEAKRQALADIRVVNQRGELVAVARHIIRWVRDARQGDAK